MRKNNKIIQYIRKIDGFQKNHYFYSNLGTLRIEILFY